MLPRKLLVLGGEPLRWDLLAKLRRLAPSLRIVNHYGPTETTVGANIYTDPVTHQKVLRSTGRVVFGADGTLDFRAGQQPFLDAFVDGDMSVFDAVCAALA